MVPPGLATISSDASSSTNNSWGNEKPQPIQLLSDLARVSSTATKMSPIASNTDDTATCQNKGPILNAETLQTLREELVGAVRAEFRVLQMAIQNDLAVVLAELHAVKASSMDFSGVISEIQKVKTEIDFSEIAGLIRDSKAKIDASQIEKEIMDFKVDLDKFRCDKMQTKVTIDDNMKALEKSDIRDAIRNMNAELQ